MPGSFAEIRQALVEEWERVNTNVLADTLPTAYENVLFTPPSNSAWAAVFLLPGLPNVGSLGPSGDDEVSGIFQIDLNYPLGEGVFRVHQAVDLLRGEFKAGKYLTYSSGTQWVLINSCGLFLEDKDDSFHRAVVRITWETRLNRQ